ncbi:MAG: lysine--tRNA ligase [Alphaproteobacteria bacterium]|nr:lysine--tRNA ligase [Alphaproteobacteria bacterium]
MSNSHSEEQSQHQVRLAKLEELKSLGINVYPSKFARTHKTVELHEVYASLENGVYTEDEVMVAGRVMSIRNSGMFIDLHDDSGKLQVYTDVKNAPEHVLQVLRNLDLGDFIGARGIVRRTPRGELTVNTLEVNLLSKALLPLPDSYYGLQDVETRYRQRYIDLIINENSRNVLRARSVIISGVRNYLLEHGFLEVETPMLHPIAGGAIAKPFVTHHNTLGIDLYLRIAPELYLKRLIVGGLSERVFEINRCFRNEGISTRHNPEFTSLELYQAYADYHDMISISEGIIQRVCELTNSSMQINFGDKVIDLSGPWPRKSMAELVREKTGVDFLTINSQTEAHEVAKRLGVHLKGNEPWGKVLETIFGEKVEHELIQPTHVTDLPRDISPLAKCKIDDPRLTERFETYMNGWEISNGFSELNDPMDQKDRFMQQVEAKDAGDDEAHEMDHDFITSLEYALPPTGGLGIGLDRLVMILTNSHSIREVIAFPTLKPKND